MKDYDLVRLSLSNFPDLLELMWIINGVAPDEEQLRRKYDTRGFGAENIGYLAYKHGDKAAAAYYGVFPLRVMLDDREILAAQSGDTMTHPNHRGKGLFIALARKTYELAEQEGVKFVFGFPNSNSYPGFVNKLGWQHPYNMIAINIIVPSLPLNLLGKHTPALARLQRKWLELLLELFFVKVDQLPEKFSSVRADGACGVIRDQVYWDYKRASCNAYRMGEAVFLMKCDGDISIGDVVVPGGEIGPVLRRLRIAAALAGIVRIKTYCSPTSQLAELLGRQGFTRESLAYGYVAFEEGLQLDKLEFTYADYDTF
jgi:GNAT superfamily N-acetyltransferase